MAALATLRIITQEDYLQQIPAKEKLLREKLQHELIIQVRTAGLWAAVEMQDFATVQAVIKECLAMGLITDWFLFNDRSLRIAPPLLITEEELLWACACILEAMDRVLAGISA